MQTKIAIIGFVLGAGLLGTLSGCAPYPQPPPPVAYYPEPPPPREGYPPPPRREFAPLPREGIAPPPPREGFAPPPPVEREAVVQDDYVYYPGYEVYYNSHRRQYTYREGDAWVSRPAPPRVAIDVLLASPSVRLDFHDAPEAHHAAVLRQYPKHWAPKGQGPGREQGRGERN